MRLVEQRGMLTAIALDPACADGIHPERPCRNRRAKSADLESY
jgi:hypothetical protein